MAIDEEFHEVTSSPAIAPVVMTTEGLPQSDRFAAWRDYCGDINAIVVAPEAEAPFEAKSENWHLGPMLLTHNITPAMELERTGRQSRRDGLEHVIIRVNRTGATLTRSGDEEYRAGPGTLVLESLRQPYHDRWTASEWVTLNIARADDPQLCADLSKLMIGPVEGVGARLLADFLLSLAARMPEMTEADLPAVAELTRTMVAASLVGASPRINAPPTAGEVLQRWQADRIIRENLGSARLDVARISELSHISRSTLYRLFEPDGGVAAYTRRLRLDLAYSILENAERRRETIASVAEQCGYHCVASFNRAFRSAFGCTPGEVRAGARGEPAERRREMPRTGTAVRLRDLL